MDKEAFGKQLLDFLKRTDMGRSGLARRLKVSPATVTQWVQGKTQPDRKHLAMLVLKLYVARDRGCSAASGAFRSRWEVIDWVRLLGYEVADLAACVAETFDEKDRYRKTFLAWLNSQKQLLVDARSQGVHLPSWYVERPAELDHLRALLTAEKGYRIPAVKRVVLWGMGGIGKTILAKAVALDEDVERYFRSGVLWAELGPEGDPHHWLERWCKLLKLSLRGDETVWELHQRVRGFLSDEEHRFLLVVDDVWRAEDLEPLLVDGPQSRVLITTRKRAILPDLGPQAQLLEVEAMRVNEALVLMRQCSGEHWAEETQTLRTARDLVEQVERLPLAVALLGGVVRLRGWQYALKRIRDERLRLGVLEVGTPRSRQGSVRLALQVSYDLLLAQEQRNFRRLGVFPYNSSIAAPVVCDIWGITDPDMNLEQNIQMAEEHLWRLYDQALLQIDSQTEESVRYRLHSVLHDYARDLLRREGEWDEARQCFIKVYALWSYKMGGDPFLWYRAWDAEIPNIRAAFEYACEEGDEVAAYILGNSCSYLLLEGKLWELGHWLARVEKDMERLSPEARGLVQHSRARLEMALQNFDTAERLQREELRNPALDARTRGYAALHRIDVCVEKGRVEEARLMLKQARALVEEAGDDPYLRIGLDGAEGKVLAAEGYTEDAIQKLCLVGQRYVEVGAWSGAVAAALDIAELHASSGRESRSWEYLQMGLAWAAKVGSPVLLFSALQAMWPLAVRLEYFELAEFIGQWMLEAVEKLGLGEKDKAHRQALALRVQSAALLAQGRHEEALPLALQALRLHEGFRGDPDTLASTWELLAEIYQALGDKENAREARRQVERLCREMGSGEPGLHEA